MSVVVSASLAGNAPGPVRFFGIASRGDRVATFMGHFGRMVSLFGSRIEFQKAAQHEVSCHFPEKRRPAWPVSGFPERVEADEVRLFGTIARLAAAAWIDERSGYGENIRDPSRAKARHVAVTLSTGAG